MTTKSWWGEQFKEALCSFMDKNRLQRGSAYRSDARIVEYTQKGNQVMATIKGNANPYYGIYTVPYYKTEIIFTPLQSTTQLLYEMEHDPLILAKLASKELPLSIAKLLPQSKSDIQTKCSCPDYENPCKHVAGLYLRLAEKMDTDPFLLLQLRDIPQDLLDKYLQTLMPPANRQRIVSLTHGKQPRHDPKGDDKPIKWRDFWGTAQKLKEPETLSTIPCLLIKKAGVNPPFWHKDKPFIDVMEPLYKTIKRSW